MMMMTTTTQLNAWAKTLFTPDDRFLGVFSSNTLPKSGQMNDVMLIVNLDTSNLPGTHWCAIKTRDDEAYYFDPFGESPPTHIAQWLTKQFHSWTANNRQVQPLDTFLCGQFCLHFLYYASLTYFNRIALYDIIDYVYPKSLTYHHYEHSVLDFMSKQGLQ